MKTCIDVLLRFDLETTDGRIIGHGRMATWVDGELPHIGEIIRPCTGRSEIDFAFERYELRVIDACRNVGGNYTQVFLCQVGFTTWSSHSGKVRFDKCSSEQVLQDWSRLDDYLRNQWSGNLKEGSVIPVLDIANQK